jgi:hypothetical protein
MNIIKRMLIRFFGVQYYIDAYGNEGTPEDFGLYKSKRRRK